MDKTKEKGKEITNALGELVVTFANLEDSLRDAISILASGPGAGRGSNIMLVMTAGMNFRTLVQMFGAGCREIGPKDVGWDEVTTFCGHLDSLAAERNTYIHSGWEFGVEGELALRFKRQATAKKGFVFKVAEVDVDEILGLSSRILGAGQKLSELKMTLMS